MANMLTRVFDVLGEAAIGLIVLVFVLAFGALLLVDLKDQVVTDYLGGNTSAENNATQIIDEGQAGIGDFSDNIGIIVLAIVFVIVLALVLLLRRQQEAV